MSLTKQIHLYSIATDAFYEPKEQYIHQRLLKLYKLRNKELPKWKKASVNRVIKKEKAKIIDLLEERLKSNEPRQLNSTVLIDKNVVSLFESALTRALDITTNSLTYDLMILNVFFFQVFESLVRDGFIYNGEKYIFLTASAGQIRTKRAVFIREAAYQKVQSRIMCGLTIEDINNQGGINPNKFLAYLALNNSATDVWEDFDIDKSIVVDDFESNVFGQVDFIDDVTYKIERQEKEVELCQTDGCGIMLDGPTRMVRLPWIKGLLVQFPFDKFIQEKCPNGKCIVTDIYGEEHDILAEGIRYIFTKSQFKLAKYFNSWSCYKERFKNNQCEACYCNIEEDYIPKARINYQMLQTLSDMKNEEIDKLIKPTLEEINSIGNDYQTTMRLLGATDYNQNPSYFQQALMLYPELFRDPYCRDVLKQTKKSLVKQAKAGRLRVNGRYRFVSPDLYAFCEWLFLGIQNPQGLLRNGEVYVNEFRDGDELACLRSPHLYREWPIRVNKRNEETEKWFGMTKCVYTSCHDLISRIVQMDFDGDRLLVIKDRLLTKVAKRNMQGIVPLYYIMKKAKGGLIDNETLYQGMVQAFTTGNIGPISNNITKIWNCGNVGKEQVDVIRWLCMENNYVIK
nr:MAG TPA: RNA dependent RNA polymerase [Caudoviricetes sp.]